MHVRIRTFPYDVRVQSLYVNTEDFQPREGRRIRKQKTVYVYCLSDWFKIAQNQSKARQRVEKNRYTLAFRAKISYDVSLANGRAPGVWFLLVFCMYVTDFGRKVARYT